MTKRGRVSMADLMTPKDATEVIQRPDAPYDLDDQESDEWRAQVGAMPADHFTRSTWPLLSMYCRHIVAATRLSQLAQAALHPPKVRGKKAELDLSLYNALLKAHRAETAAAQRLARSMRLTQQSYIKSETLGTRMKKQATLTAMPWEAEEDE